MKHWLVCLVSCLLWTCCASQGGCEEPPDIDFGEIVSDEKVSYREHDRIQYRCSPLYALEGSEWISCDGQRWTPPPKCLAPCSITRQQLDAKNLLISGGRRRSQLIQSNHTLEFICREGYVITTPSVRKCVDGHMDLPACISERGKNCSRPPPIENGDIITLVQKQYPSGSWVEFKCQLYYAMEGPNRSFCNNGTWTKVPACLEPCVIALAESQQIVRKGSSYDNGFQTTYLPRGDSLELSCKPGYVLETNPSQSALLIQCNEEPIVYPKCKEITCNPPQVTNGTFRPQRNMYQGADLVLIECNRGLQLENGQNIVECTSSGWSPSPQCGEITCQLSIIEHGHVISPSRVYKEHDTLQFTCDSGYKHVERSDARCTQNGWYPKPACTETVCSPPEVANGHFNPRLSLYRNEDEVYIQCEPGYRLQHPGDSSTCTETGWSPSPKCIRKPCDVPTIKNGRLTYSFREYHSYYFPRKVGETVDYECNSGFLSMNKNYWGRSTCRDLDWDPEPRCVKQCIAPRSLPHGRLIYNSWTTYIEENEISYFCDEGYYPASPEAKTKCTKHGWAPTPRCVEIVTCKIIPPPNGYFHQHNRAFALHETTIYGCQSGYTTPKGLDRGETQCLEEGWTPKPECIQTCQKPPARNMIFINTTKSVFLFMEKLVYECQDGYETSSQTIGDQTICTEKGWNPKPDCQRIQCDVPTLEYGRIQPRKDQYFEGDVVRFSCLGGRFRVGITSAQCYHFGWSPPPPICKDRVNPCSAPPGISDGRITHPLLEEYSHGAKVEYECNGRFAIVGSSQLECVDGEWTTLPSCTVEEKTCGPSPNITNGHPVSEDGDKYFHGDTMSYKCEENTFSIGPNPAKCLHGKWELPSCVGHCPPPPQLPNAIIQVLNFGSVKKIRFKCKEHFKLQGPQEIACENGKWQRPPRCLDLRCEDPPAIENGDVKGNRIEGKYPPGRPVEYQCHDGFEISGKRSVTCSNKKWSPPPTCNEKPCRNPPTVSGSSVVERVKTIYQAGETVTYTCHPGFGADGPLTVTCRRGEWTEPPVCEDKTCQELPSVDNADVLRDAGAPYLPGHQVQYQCHEGFEMSGSDTIICENKAWSKPPVCKDATCRPPPAVSHGHLDGQPKERYLPFEKVRYRCDRGWSLFGPQSVTCSNKKWSELPQCREAGGRCDRPPVIENGDILDAVLSRYESNSVVHYKCQAFYIMHGHSDVRCVNGHWTEVPRCIAPCTTSEEEMQSHNIQLRWLRKDKLYSQSGDVMEFRCRHGFHPAPSSPPFRVPCIEGQLEYPSCIRSSG
ncbi:complement factor H-like isoform X2 [Tiliqua scincoides]|uniref:complement factor H-like isoform X2 n=1 Tax=Tiliqua scincoides TaxID=71010 RepID=UPI00346191C5